MKLELAVLAGAALIAASILFIGRYEISATAYGFAEGDDKTANTSEEVYRLDRWTGRIVSCSMEKDPTGWRAELARTGEAVVSCQFSKDVREKMGLDKPAQ